MEQQPDYGSRASDFMIFGGLAVVVGAPLTVVQAQSLDASTPLLVVGWLLASFGWVFLLAGAIGSAIADIHEDRDRWYVRRKVEKSNS